MTIDLTGHRFGRLLVLGRLPNRGKQLYYLCKCDCGKEKEVAAKHLRSGATTSCGCYVREINTKHNLSHTRLYKIYDHIKRRCYSDTDHSKYYKDKGITVCQKWLESFEDFYNWSIQNGYKDNLTIDRINVNGNYCPENCRWVSRKEQSRNTTRNIKLQGICQSEWCELLAIDETKVSYLTLHKGLSLKEALKKEYFLEKNKNLPDRIFNLSFDTLDKYQAQANVTLNNSLSNDELLINCGLGLAGECGEVVDILKKWHGQGHCLDKKHIILELGDVLFYLAGICYALDTTLSKVAKINIIKICNRYGDKFDSEKSINRKEGDI